MRAVSSEGYGRIRKYGVVRRKLEEDKQFRLFFEQGTDEIPQFYIDQVREDLGPMWDWLPKGALSHDPNAYLNSTTESMVVEPEIQRLAVNE